MGVRKRQLIGGGFNILGGSSSNTNTGSTSNNGFSLGDIVGLVGAVGQVTGNQDLANQANAVNGAITGIMGVTDGSVTASDVGGLIQAGAGVVQAFNPTPPPTNAPQQTQQQLPAVVGPHGYPINGATGEEYDPNTGWTIGEL